MLRTEENTVVAMSSSDVPPPPNPMLSAYEEFTRSTPFVTRSLLHIQAVSYLVSWIFNPYYALANIPHFVVFQYEIYRLLLSPLVNTSLINLVFVFWSFVYTGRRLEQSLGSTQFAWLCICVGLLTNLAFLTFSLVLYMLDGFEKSHLFGASEGMWIVLFGLIALECCQAPRGTKRQLFVLSVPTLYYPLALFVLFGLLSASFSFAHLLSIGIGYAYGFGYLEKSKLPGQKAHQWEETWLHTWTRREGWVTAPAALGSDAWSILQDDGMVRYCGSCPRERVVSHAVYSRCRCSVVPRIRLVIRRRRVCERDHRVFRRAVVKRWVVAAQREWTRERLDCRRWKDPGTMSEWVHIHCM